MRQEISQRENNPDLKNILLPGLFYKATVIKRIFIFRSGSSLIADGAEFDSLKRGNL